MHLGYKPIIRNWFITNPRDVIEVCLQKCYPEHWLLIASADSVVLLGITFFHGTLMSI